MAWTEWVKVHKEKSFYRTYDFNEGTWDGNELKSGEWCKIVPIAPSEDIFESGHLRLPCEILKDIGDLRRLKNISVNIFENDYGIRMYGGLASDGSIANLYTTGLTLNSEGLLWGNDPDVVKIAMMIGSCVIANSSGGYESPKRYIQVYFYLDDNEIEIRFINESTKHGIFSVYVPPKIAVSFKWE